MTAQSMSPDRARALIADRMATPAPNRPPPLSLAETLMQLGCIDAEAAAEIENKRGRRAFGRTAVDLGYITRRQLVFALGVHLGFLRDTDEPIDIPEEIVVAHNPYSKAAEEFRALRTRLTTGADLELTRRLSVTGARLDATHTAVNLAASFAQLGKATLLVDADLRRPSLARVFGVRRAPGLADVVAYGYAYEAARCDTLVKNLDLMPAGHAAPDPQRVLGDPAFGGVIGRASQEYEIVVMLTSPYGVATDCEFVWTVASGALVVAKKNETRFEDLQAISRTLRRVDTPAAGAILIE